MHDSVDIQFEMCLDLFGFIVRPVKNVMDIDCVKNVMDSLGCVKNGDIGCVKNGDSVCENVNNGDIGYENINNGDIGYENGESVCKNEDFICKKIIRIFFNEIYKYNFNEIYKYNKSDTNKKFVMKGDENKINDHVIKEDNFVMKGDENKINDHVIKEDNFVMKDDENISNEVIISREDNFNYINNKLLNDKELNINENNRITNNNVPNDNKLSNEHSLQNTILQLYNIILIFSRSLNIKNILPYEMLDNKAVIDLFYKERIIDKILRVLCGNKRNREFCNIDGNNMDRNISMDRNSIGNIIV
ncbi:hypothetical protein NAPIS_ORF02460 [Vairimorpha apis BRL 01]|uniref:Uncharacterized protein n=1 Tax=Vairimorpha apis BRL 01 TaxID=1037528 RepID=T0L5P2_9MICR|nr:hypothetical protein NAPIS_ORF02460 [Vairimorpha apis BRL 01]